MPTTLDSNNAIPTTLQESVNIVLSVLGEAPVNSLTGTTASLGLNIIEEVSTDIQSKGWWFNQQTSSNFDPAANIIIYPSNSSSNWHANIPEEARRYITIRAARIAHTRLIGTEDNFKFSFQEEQVSLAILQQAHVRNSNSDLSFSSYPSDLKNLGIDEYIFLQSNLEEKLGTLKLATTLKEQTILGKQASKLDEEIDLLQTQDTLVTAQAQTEGSKKTDIEADTTIKGKQGSLIDAQVTTEGVKATDIGADTTLKGKQGSLLDAQVTTEGVKATDIGADTTLKGKQGSLIDAQAQTEGSKKTDIEADTTIKGKQGSLIDAQAATEGSKKTDIEADTTLKGKQGSLLEKQALDVAKDTEVKGVQKGLLGAQKTLSDKQALTEIKKALDVVADTTLKGKQGSLVDAQATDVAADTTLKGKQGSLVDAQATDVAADTTLKGKQGSLVDAQATDVAADTSLKTKQGLLVDAQEIKTDAESVLISAQAALTVDQEAKTVEEKNLILKQKDLLIQQTSKAELEGSIEKNYYNRLTSNTINAVTTYRTWGTALRMIGIQEKEFNALPVYKKREFLYNARKYNIAIATETGTDAFEIATVNKIMSLIGEAPVTALNTNAMASEAVRHLRRANDEVQARGWWFNTETDVEVNPISSRIAWLSSWLNIEINNIPTTKQKVGSNYYVRNLETKSYQDWSGTQKATIIYKRDLEETPQKFQELLEVRVARLLTELYPQSGIDVQRLPKMEAELMTYFKDRENDQGNYSVFDNYDAAVRVGINRSYNLF